MAVRSDVWVSFGSPSLKAVGGRDFVRQRMARGQQVCGAHPFIHEGHAYPGTDYYMKSISKTKMKGGGKKKEIKPCVCILKKKSQQVQHQV